MFTNEGRKNIPNITLQNCQQASQEQNKRWWERRLRYRTIHSLSKTTSIESKSEKYIKSFGKLPSEKENVFFLIWADYVKESKYDGYDTINNVVPTERGFANATFSYAIPSDITLQLLTALIAKYANNKVLEIGAGSGYWAYNLARYNNKVTIVEDGRENLKPEYTRLAPPNNPITVHYPCSAEKFMEDYQWSTHGALFLCWPRPSQEMIDVVQKYAGNLIIVIGLHLSKEKGLGLTLNVEDVISPTKWKKREGKEIPLPRWPNVFDSIQIWIRKDIK